MGLYYSSADIFVINAGVNNGTANPNVANSQFGNPGDGTCDVTPMFLAEDDNRATLSDDVTTRQQSASVDVSGWADAGGYVGIDPSGTVAVGDVLCVDGVNNDAFNQCYLLVGTSGNYYVTSTAWFDCTPAPSGGTYTKNTGTLDDPDQNDDFIVMGASNIDAIQCHQEGVKHGIHTFGTDYTFTLVSCDYVCFTTKCDIALATGTFGTDQISAGIFEVGGCVRSFDLVDNSGLVTPGNDNP